MTALAPPSGSDRGPLGANTATPSRSPRCGVSAWALIGLLAAVAALPAEATSDRRNLARPGGFASDGSGGDVAGEAVDGVFTTLRPCGDAAFAAGCAAQTQASHDEIGFFTDAGQAGQLTFTLDLSAAEPQGAARFQVLVARNGEVNVWLNNDTAQSTFVGNTDSVPDQRTPGVVTPFGFGTPMNLDIQASVLAGTHSANRLTIDSASVADFACTVRRG